MKKIIFALASCAVLASCVKEKDKEPIDVSKTTYLLDGRWQLKSYIRYNDLNDTLSVSDALTPMSGCEKDNYFDFTSANTVFQHEGNSKCEITAPDSLEYRYSLTSDDRYLRIWSNPDDADNSIVLAGDIKYPSIDSFVLSYTQPSPQDSTIIQKHVKTYLKLK